LSPMSARSRRSVQVRQPGRRFALLYAGQCLQEGDEIEPFLLAELQRMDPGGAWAEARWLARDIALESMGSPLFIAELAGTALRHRALLKA